MTTMTAVDVAVGRLLIDPIRHAYALLWRAGILNTDEETKK